MPTRKNAKESAPVRVSIFLTKDQHTEARVEAARRNIPLTQLIAEALAFFIPKSQKRATE